MLAGGLVGRVAADVRPPPVGSGGATGGSGGATGGSGGGPVGGPIIADHTIVDRYGDIPQSYLEQVQEMWFNIIGESHSTGYLRGLEFLALSDSEVYAVIRGNDGGGLRRFDGGRWVVERTPALVTPGNLASPGPGDLWAWREETRDLWHRREDGSWAAVSLRVETEAGDLVEWHGTVELWPRTKDDVWLIGANAEGGAIVARSMD